MATSGGQAYDYLADTIVTTAIFPALGIGLRDSAFGYWAMAAGALVGISVWRMGVLSETIEVRQHREKKAWSGALNFYPEDLLYLIGPLAWSDWLLPMLVVAVIGAPAVMFVMDWRLARLASGGPEEQPPGKEYSHETRPHSVHARSAHDPYRDPSGHAAGLGVARSGLH
jgi:hypothetical protein